MADGAPNAVVVVGASAGGVDALKGIAARLPRDLPAPVGVVLHVSPRAESRLPQILARAGPMPALHPRDGEPLYPGRIYVAPPDRHLLVRDGRWGVVRGPREHHVRPAIDPLFRSAAARFGDHVVGVILSGTRADGVAGAVAVSRVGGAVLVQDPEEAEFPDMPSNAIAHDHPDRVLPIKAIPDEIVNLVERLTDEPVVSDNVDEEMSLETSYAALDESAVDRNSAPGEPSAFSCPACGGVLWEIEEGDMIRFRCRVGHAYNGDSALDDQAESVEAALWSALRALHERASLAQRLAVRQRERGSALTSTRFDRVAGEALEQAEIIRRALLDRNGG
jgi:two-component system chemotaxis response regulator CheB